MLEPFLIADADDELVKAYTACRREVDKLTATIEGVKRKLRFGLWPLAFGLKALLCMYETRVDIHTCAHFN